MYIKEVELVRELLVKVDQSKAHFLDLDKDPDVFVNAFAIEEALLTFEKNPGPCALSSKKVPSRPADSKSFWIVGMCTVYK